MIKKRYDTKKLREIQRIIARRIDLKDRFDKKNIKTIAGFDVSIHENQLICAAVVLSYPDLKLLEKKFLIKPAPMPYVPTFMAFREGPIILELYYDLEIDPDLIMLDGHGIAHMYKCGIASYVGHEISKPTIGVGKGMPEKSSIHKDTNLVINDEIRGFLVKTKEFAKPLIVSPGHMITRESARDFVKECVRLPHKLPEPIHIAHRYAEKKKKVLILTGSSEKVKEKQTKEKKSEEQNEEKSEYMQAEEIFAAMPSFD